MTKAEIISRIENLIARDELDQAIDLGIRYLKNGEFILLASRYNRALKDNRKGISTPEQHTLTLNNVTQAILDNLKQYPSIGERKRNQFIAWLAGNTTFFSSIKSFTVLSSVCFLLFLSVGLLKSDSKKPGFEYINYSRIVDLRNRVEVPRDSVLLRPISPVYVTRVITIVKKEKGLKQIELPMGTMGYSIETRCPTHNHILSRREEKDHEHWGRKIRKWTALIDVENERVGIPFTIVIESIFWNGFPNSTDEWYALHADNGEPSTLVMIFSKAKSPKRFRQMYYEGPNYPQSYKGTSRLTFSDDTLVCYWEVINPDPRYTFEIQWDW